MLNQIQKAFKTVDARLHQRARDFTIMKLDTLEGAVAEMEAGFKSGDTKYMHLTSGYGRFDRFMAVANHFGSKGLMNLLYNRGRQGALECMAKNVDAKIEKRNNQIVSALTKKGITVIEDFELLEISDGYEGTFYVDGHKVTITTILAGGYNIQCLHNRTLVKVK